MTESTLCSADDGHGIPLRVRGRCMDPVLEDGESVRIRRAKWYLPGDVIAYYCPHQGRSFVHRFLGYVPASGSWKCLTMPDHGVKPDVLVDPANILGKVLDKENRSECRTLVQRWRALWRYFYWVARITMRNRS